MQLSLQPLRYRASILLPALILLAIVILLFSVMVGSVALPLSELPSALGEVLQGAPSTMTANLLDLRLSRAMVAFSTGAALGLAGVMMQALLRNPLADPYVLGISGGAAVGALFAMLLMLASWLIDAAAFGGAVGVSLLLYFLARRDLGGASGGGTSLLLLTGVIVSSACMALVTLMLSMALLET